MNRFSGRVAIVSGAGRGIGAAIAKRLASEGATVAAVDIDGDSAGKTAQAAEGEVFSRYHAEAGIAAEHCLAPSFAETNWARVVELSCFDQSGTQLWRHEIRASDLKFTPTAVLR